MCCTACRCCRAVLASFRDRGASLEEVASRAHRDTHNRLCKIAAAAALPLFLPAPYFASFS